ncbi:HNH endonuclease family protein [Bdellovibrio sp. PAP01]|uniref:HNH endonuclease family protein n=2 Tax=Bdellovibrio svalbardensis TaxID=2972972 RepID=A0ABT6DQB8_9BACT|nr:HNH endonuclease family protein [Bdellovibrio svalbardensis]
MKIQVKYVVVLSTLLFSLVARTQEASPGSSTQAPTAQTQAPLYQQYYTVNEAETEKVTVPTKKATFSMAADLSPEHLLQSAQVVVVNLLKWLLHDEPLSIPQEKYLRKLHFGRWINDPTDDTCMNTRARVLVRDSQVDVTYRGPRQCSVEAGKWQDPYAGQEVTEAKAIQIDHMVPLKNAYLSGAWEWDYKTRCLYANYMNFKPHLVSSGAHENMSKSDKGPEGYLPPNENFRCEYIRNWVAVKAIWHLRMNPVEVQAIYDAVKQYNCNLNSFKMSLDGLAKQREFIEANLNFCIVNKR